MTIATTILAQLGGNKFLAMTGARKLLNGGNYLQFDLPRGAKNKATKVRITLTPADEYDMTFYRWNARQFTADEVGNVQGLHAEDLQRVFTAETGLDTRL